MLPLDVDSLVVDFDLTPALGPLKVERRLAAVLNEFGERVSPAPTFLRVRPWTAHTASGRNLLQVPEADRNSEVIEVYVRNVRLYVADSSRSPDVVHYEGRRFRVVTVNRFAKQGNVYFALAVLLDEQDAEA
jgi:hypothetical protein